MNVLLTLLLDNTYLDKFNKQTTNINTNSCFLSNEEYSTLHMLGTQQISLKGCANFFLSQRVLLSSTKYFWKLASPGN